MFDMGGMYLLLGVLFLAGLLVLGVYLVHSLGLWLMAKKAGLPYAPLAWVPFAKYGVLGSLCDRSIAFRTGRRWRLAVVLPVLSLLAPSTLQLILLEYLLPDAAFLYSYTGYSLQQLFRLVFLVVHTAGLYYLYSDYAPAQAVLYTILSFVFSFIAPAVLLLLLYKQLPLSAGGQPPAYGPPPAFTTGWGNSQPPRRRYDDPPVGLNRLPQDREAPYPPRDDFSGRNGPEL